jgi:hypothetical protein
MTTSSGMAPLLQTYEAALAAEATAGTGQEAQLCVAPWPGTLAEAYYTPEGAITGVATNNKAITVRNRGAAGAGATVMATLTFGAGTSGVAFDESALTLSGTPANVAFAQGDVITAQSTVNGTGMTLPEGKVRVVLSRA